MRAKLSVGMQLVILFVVLSVFSVGIQLFFTIRSVSHVTTEDAVNLLKETAANQGNQVKSDLDGIFILARAMRTNLLTIQEMAKQEGQEPSRKMAQRLAENFLRNNSTPLTSALWVIWEPNAFDGQDAKFAGRDGYDASGRMVSYWVAQGGQVVAQPLVGYDVPGNGDYYLDVLKSGQESIIEPFTYEDATGKFLMTSIVVPIIQNNKVVGACGIDVHLDVIAEEISKINPMGVGKAGLISTTGTLVAHPQREILGSSFFDISLGRLVADNWKSSQARREQLATVVPNSWSDGGDTSFVSFPFSPGQTSSTWSFVAMVPMSKIMESTQAIVALGFKVGAAVLAVAVAFGLLAVKFVVGGLTRRIMAVVYNLERESDVLTSNVDEISKSSHDIADGAQSQASSLEETSAAIEEITSMTKSNAENAELTHKTAQETLALVTSGSAAVRDMSLAMGQISESASKIGDIIKTIESIASQTNLLALNAAVEAARAGEAGAGFAVVADEVRNLAMRSTDAVSSTASLIEDTIKRVQNGSEISETVGASFANIEQSSSNIGSLIEQISSATREQYTGVGQVSQAMGAIDKVTYENVASVNKLSAATEELSTQARHINDSIEDLLKTIGGRRHSSSYRK